MDSSLRLTVKREASVKTNASVRSLMKLQNRRGLKKEPWETHSSDLKLLSTRSALRAVFSLGDSQGTFSRQPPTPILATFLKSEALYQKLRKNLCQKLLLRLPSNTS